jgi:hypothetical protein
VKFQDRLAILEGKVKVFVVNPDQEYTKQDQKKQELHEAFPFFTIVHLVHRDAK